MHEFGFLFVEMSKCTKYITNSQMNRGTHSVPEKSAQRMINNNNTEKIHIKN